MNHATNRRTTLATATAAAACVSALFLATGCQPAPKVNAFTDTPVQQATEVRLQETTPAVEPLQPFDERFYVAPPEAQAEVASAP